MHIDLKKYCLKTEKNINIKIMHISDIHFSLNYKIKRLDMVLNKIKENYPNYICITGDLIDVNNITKDKSFIYFEKFINNLASISKVIISIGNHEYFVEESKNKYSLKDDISWLKKFKNKNIIVLDNEIYKDDNINFIGFNPEIEYYKKNEIEILKEDNIKLYKLLNKVNDKYNILLCHTPMYLYQSKNYEKIKDLKKIDLVLCGHTHGGMIPSFIPGRFGIISPSKRLFPKNIRGINTINGVTIIISSGVTKLSRKSKLMQFTDVYGANINEIKIN